MVMCKLTCNHPFAPQSEDGVSLIHLIPNLLLWQVATGTSTTSLTIRLSVNDFLHMYHSLISMGCGWHARAVVMSVTLKVIAAANIATNTYEGVVVAPIKYALAILAVSPARKMQMKPREETSCV